MSQDSLKVNGYDFKALQTCYKYGTGMELDPSNRPYSAMDDAYLYGGGLKVFSESKPFFKGAKLPAGQSIMDTYRHYQLAQLKGQLPKVPPTPAEALTGKALKEYNNAVTTASKYNNARQIIDGAAGQTGRTLKNTTRAAEQAIAQAKHATHVAKATGEIKAVGIGGHVGKFAKTVSGYNKGKGLVLKGLANSSKLRAVGKFCKGKGALAAFDGCIELATNVLPAYSISQAAGRRQLQKSAIKVGASVGGFAAGSWAAGLAGAKIGAAIGSFGGPICTAIGGVVGAVIGAVGGWLGAHFAGKAAEKVVGGNEVELYQEKEAAIAAQRAMSDNNYAEEMLMKAGYRLAQEEQAPSKDYAQAKEAIESTVTTLTQKTVIAE